MSQFMSIEQFVISVEKILQILLTIIMLLNVMAAILIKKVQVGTKHHDAITHQEERTVVVKPAWMKQ